MSQHVQLSDRIPLDEEDSADSANVLDAITKHFNQHPEVASFADSDTH